jgi:DNA-binding NarL/FixJ family response regulator
MSSNGTHRTAVLCDQHPLWLDAVDQVLARMGIKAVGKATSPERALKLVEEERPDLFVTEIEAPGGDARGIASIREARDRHPNLKAIVLSTYEDSDHIDQALAAGAVAYIVKTAHPDDLASAVRQAFTHSIYFAAAPPRTPASNRDFPAVPAELTRRELEILRLVAEGLSNAALARRLWVTEQTVKFHLANIYRKLGVSNRTEASRWAQLHGLLPPVALQTSTA